MAPCCIDNSYGFSSQVSRSYSLPDLRALEVSTVIWDDDGGNNEQLHHDNTSKSELDNLLQQYDPQNSQHNNDNSTPKYQEQQKAMLLQQQHDVVMQRLSGFFLGDNDNQIVGEEEEEEEEEKSGYFGSPTSILDVDRKTATKDNNMDESWHNKVSFSSKQSVRYYNVCLGDNPSCTYGLPISLGWEYEEDEEDIAGRKQPLSYFSSSSRSSSVQRLSYEDRRQLLESAGYEYNEMRSTLLEVKRVQRERIMTELFMPLYNVIDNITGGIQMFFDL